MQVKELRIGNIIQYQHNQCKVTGLFEDGTVHTVSGNQSFSAHASAYMPVKITENILLSMGYEKHPFLGGSYSKKYPFYTLIIDENPDKSFYIGFDDDTSNYINQESIFYLHELQNLLYIISGVD